MYSDTGSRQIKDPRPMPGISLEAIRAGLSVRGTLGRHHASLTSIPAK